MTRLLAALGYGYVAKAVARLLAARGWEVVGTGRSPRDGVIVFDGATATDRLRFAIARADAVLISIPPDAEGDPAFRTLGGDIAARAPWVGYLSTVGVYGDRGGGWAFESEAPTPSEEKAKRRVLAENQWRTLPAPAEVFRLPGIYGPGRSAFDRLRAGDAHRAVKPGLVFSRAHVDDIATAVVAAIDRPALGAIYNVCDDHPSPPQDVISHAAHLLGVPPPPLAPVETAGLSPAAMRFYGASRRISNARVKARLGWRPAYPSYREGLAAILAAESG